MKVFVNGRAVQVLQGMTVRHAVRVAGFLEEVARGKRVFDQWDNEVGLDGALAEGMRLTVR